MDKTYQEQARRDLMRAEMVSLQVTIPFRFGEERKRLTDRLNILTLELEKK